MARWSFLPRMTRAVVYTLRPLLMVTTRRDWRGGETFPKDRGFIVAVNHLSYTDPILFAHFLVDHGVVPRYLVKDTLMDHRVLGPLLRPTEQIPVHRSTSAAVDSLQKAIEAVAAGKAIAIYPEGTITRDEDVWPMSARTGAVRVAHATGAPLYPVAQWGPQEIMGPYVKEFKLFPRKTIRVRVGAPLDLSWLGESPSEDDLRRASDQLMDAITDLLAEIRGERPTRPRFDVRTLGRHRSSYAKKQGRHTNARAPRKEQD